MQRDLVEKVEGFIYKDGVNEAGTEVVKGKTTGKLDTSFTSSSDQKLP